MNSNVSEKNQSKGVSLRGLSIRHRLPLLICILLLSIVVAFGWLSYYGVRKSAFEIGKERLGGLTEQLSSLFGQSSIAITSATHTTAQQETIKKFLNSPGMQSDSVKLVLDKLRFDSTWILVELLNADHQSVIRSTTPGSEVKIHSEKLIPPALLSKDSSFVGKIYKVGDSIYYPIIAAVTENKIITGYLLRWRVQTSTAKGMEQFSKLLGTNAKLYLGNKDGSLWTDLIESVPAPPINKNPGEKFSEYSRADQGPVIASASDIPGTPWIIVIEFSQSVILKGPDLFLNWLAGIGAVVVIIGILLAWLMSRNLTRPLNKLAAATSVIAKGDYSVSVEVGRKDELGKLARDFNAMAVQVKGAQQNLEKKVQERTAQLEAVNKELEAFSYSVSHDLRAPLRSITGYATILKEDYASKLDDEANRVTDKIISNARKMGLLIDDLIAFSQMARKELRHQSVNMQRLVESCMEELLQNESANKYKILVHPLLPCVGDEALIKQVWINLISNAIKYSSKKSAPSIEIGSKNGTSMNEYYVRDNGAGFDMKYAHKLFGVFQRLHSNKEFDGSGIGLALVKRIINRHNGDIHAEAAVGEGATFYFSLSKIN
jgi:signal transduction histidine kinase